MCLAILKKKLVQLAQQTNYYLSSGTFIKNSKIKRANNEVLALGRTMQIGDLYDMTEDKVVMQGLNAFKYNKPKWTENSHTEHKISIEKKDSDKYDLLDIDHEL
jgi:hypothetical protein